MPALSFQEEWINKLLRGDKQQTTRPQTDRIKVGDICSIYNQQRRRITDKPLLRLTKAGIASMPMDRYPFPSNNPPMHYAHLLGKVEITEVYDIRPFEMSGEALDIWAIEDGFNKFSTVEFDCADEWFSKQHGNDWMTQTWTVIRWNGWQERYFLADEGDVL